MLFASAYNLSIKCDRVDREYVSGEKVTGHVCLEADKDAASCKVVMRYRWESRSPSGTDPGEECEVTIYDGCLTAGDILTLPFHFSGCLPILIRPMAEKITPRVPRKMGHPINITKRKPTSEHINPWVAPCCLPNDFWE